jgi:excisionase family DNA binding protein
MSKDVHRLAKLVAETVLGRLDDKFSQFFENMNNEWLSTRQAAAYLGITENNLRNKVSRGIISVDGRLGKSLRFKKTSLDNLLSNPNKGAFNG